MNEGQEAWKNRRKGKKLDTLTILIKPNNSLAVYNKSKQQQNCVEGPTTTVSSYSTFFFFCTNIRQASSQIVLIYVHLYDTLFHYVLNDVATSSENCATDALVVFSNDFLANEASSILLSSATSHFSIIS